MPPVPTLLGKDEVAEMLGVEAGTVKKWLQRNVMAPPTHTISGRPVWDRKVVLKWAGDTGRLRGRARRREYKEAFGIDAQAPRAGGRLPAGEDPQLDEPRRTARQTAAVKQRLASRR